MKNNLEQDVSFKPQEDDREAVFLDENDREYVHLMTTTLLGKKLIFVKFIESPKNGYIDAERAKFHQCILRPYP